MRVYLDTGLFLDYLAPRGHAGTFLRTANRRGRTINDLSEDAAECLACISPMHEGMTSCLTLYEVEHTMYEKLKNLSTGLTDHHRYLITSARSLTIQVLSMVRYHGIRVLDLSQSVFEKAASELELQSRAIRAADSIHMATAMMNSADVIVTADDHLLGLDCVFRNPNGAQIRCVDTDVALTLLK
jgi:predicted nucleic acid-binding protein